MNTETLVLDVPMLRVIDEDPPFDQDLFLALLGPWSEQKSQERRGGEDEEGGSAKNGGKRSSPKLPLVTDVPVIMQCLFLQSLPLENGKVPLIPFIDRLLNFLLRHRDRSSQCKLCRYWEIPRCSSWVRLLTCPSSQRLVLRMVQTVQTVEAPQLQLLDWFVVLPVVVQDMGFVRAVLGQGC